MPKLAKSLTDASVKNFKAKDKPYKVPAGRGLHLLVKPDGSKFWVFRFRFNGKENSLSMGRYPDVSLFKAEQKVRDAHAQIAEGVNPSENRKALRASIRSNSSNSFEVIALEWISSHMRDKAPSHRDRTLRRFEIYLFPWIGQKSVADLTAQELLASLRRIQEQNKIETAHRVLQAAGQVLRYAVQTGRASRDITSDLKGALPASTVKHMAAFTEPKDVAEFLRAIDGFTGTFTVQTALKIAPLVFVRPGELRKAKWADINLDEGDWRFRVTKTKTDHIVPLSKQVIELLKAIHPLSGHGEFVFMGGHDPKKPMSDAAVNAALRRMGYDTQTEITGHGFRAMARTILQERLGIDPAVIELQLAHKVPDVLGNAYNRTKFIQQRRLMMQEWANYLDELKEGTKVLAFSNAS